MHIRLYYGHPNESRIRCKRPRLEGRRSEGCSRDGVHLSHVATLRSFYPANDSNFILHERGLDYCRPQGGPLWKVRRFSRYGISKKPLFACELLFDAVAGYLCLLGHRIRRCQHHCKKGPLVWIVARAVSTFERILAIRAPSFRLISSYAGTVIRRSQRKPTISPRCLERKNESLAGGVPRIGSE